MTRKVIVLQAVPGSGKSTFAAQHWPDAYKVSADDFHMVDGVYCFDPTKAGEAHAACLRKFTGCVTKMGRGPEPVREVVVDNTNIHLWEMAPYVALANAYKWDVEIHTLKVHPEISGPRNIHGVPQPVVDRMWREMEHPLPFWGESFEHFWQTSLSESGFLLGAHSVAGRECAWCGAEVEKGFPNRRDEMFCSVGHRSASNRALKRLLDGDAKRAFPAPGQAVEETCGGD